MRGKVPRSFDLELLNPNYSDAYLYDAALAIIATSGVRANTLAAEIVVGSILAQTDEGSVPKLADNLDPTDAPNYIQNNAVAILAYAFGYYLELNPNADNGCTIALALRKLLAYLEGQRNFINWYGLIQAGTDSEGDPDPAIQTEDNVLAYFAFKQAGFVLGEEYYLATAEALKSQILGVLRHFSGRFYTGIAALGSKSPDFDSPSPLEYSHVYAFGALFLNEIGEKEEAASLLSIVESFRTEDQSNGAIGYKVSSTGEDIVWFEASYAIALAYYKIGNKPKYNQIISDLNQYIDLSDGGILGSMIKGTSLEDTFFEQKGVGSTSWGLIANNLKTSVFETRSVNAIIEGCATVYFNEEQSDDFTRDNCTAGFDPETITYTIAAGRYLSTISQADANNKALADIAANGQAYANANADCVGEVGNEVQSELYTKNDCPSGQAGTTVTYTVPANTYFAATLEDANQLALDDIDENGQDYANLTGECTLSFITINLSVNHSTDEVGSYDYINVVVSADAPVTNDIYVQLAARDNTNALYILPGVYIYLGDTNSVSVYCGKYLSSLEVEVEISAVSPNPDSLNTVYEF